MISCITVTRTHVRNHKVIIKYHRKFIQCHCFTLAISAVVLGSPLLMDLSHITNTSLNYTLKIKKDLDKSEHVYIAPISFPGS